MLENELIDEAEETTEDLNEVEEKKVLETEEVKSVELEPKNSVPEYTEIELEALKLGWNPNYVGPDKRSAKEYIMSGHLYKANRNIEQLSKQVESLVNYNKKIEENSQKKALEELKRQIKEATEVGDIQAVDNLTEMYTDLKIDEKKKIEKVEDERQLEIPSEIKAFNERNSSWCNSNTPENIAMVAFVRAKADELSKQRPDLSLSEIVNFSELEVKKVFSHRFENQLQIAPAKVMSSSKDVALKSSKDIVSISALPADLKDVYLAFKKYDPALKLEDFVKRQKIEGLL